MKAKDYQDQMTLAWSEEQLQDHVCQLLDAGGWTWHHETDSRRSKAGFPDLVMLHPRWGVLLWRELKSEKGRVRPDQQRWLDDLVTSGQDASVWRPRDVVSGVVQSTLLARPGQRPTSPEPRKAP